MTVTHSAPVVLIVEADRDYRETITRCAELAGVAVELATNHRAAYRKLQARRFALIIWGAPRDEPAKADIVSQLRDKSGCPVILLDETLTEARETFEAGATQVLPKPFVPGALVGAIQATLRDRPPDSVVSVATRIEVGGAVFDADRRTVGHRGATVTLTKREWALLAFFLSKPNQFFTADELARQAWGSPDHSPDQVRGYVRRLRGKLDPLELPMRITSHQGSGYQLALAALDAPT